MALRRAIRVIATEDYDAVLMNCPMPEMNGVEATLRTRGGGGLFSTIGIRASPGPDVAARCMEAGMDQVLVKPVLLSDLERALAWAKSSPGSGSTNS